MASREVLASIWDENDYMNFPQLSSTRFNLFYRRINIVFIKDGIHSLVDIVITDLTRTNLFPQSCTTQRFATSNIVQTKENKTTITIDTLETFGCLHK
jgi:hypothetical protein